MNKKKLIMWLCILCCCATLSAQYGTLTSSIVGNDDSVTFRYYAPYAKSVLVNGQFMVGDIPLIKDDKGVWSVTVKPEKADIYPYNFIVDGTRLNDPGNKLLSPTDAFKSSLLEMPDPDALYTINPVPHGKVHYCTYRSHVLQQYRTVVIYTPAEYDLSAGKKYPVFYLVSGTTDSEESWYKTGRANTILDNLIARGQAEPMIVVMPYGYMNGGTPRPHTMEAGEMYNTFARELTECVIPYVEQNFRTINDRDHRAIAGFSRGGGQSMFTALKHSDRIGWMGSYSAYLTPQVMDKYFPNLKEKANSLNMLWFCVGKDDILYKEVISNTKYFNEKGIHYEIDDREGAHTWMHARYCLAETYKKLFKDKKESEKYPGIMIDASTLPGFSVFYPTNLKEMVAKQGRLPVYIHGNGACTHYSGDYQPMFVEMVKNGYVVISVGAVDGDITVSDMDDNLLDAVDWVCRQSSTSGSDFYQMIDRFKIAVGGHSCGGAQAISVSYDPRVSTTMVLNAGMGNIEMAHANANSLKQYHKPVIYLIGGPKDIAYSNANIDFESINHVPVVSVNFPVGHAGTYKQPEGGVLGKVALMWLDWQLKGKKEASRFFLDAGWRKKNFPECDFKSKGLK